MGGTLAKWKASGEYSLDRHVAAVGCDMHSGCYGVEPVRILLNYSKGNWSARLPKSQVDTITGGLPRYRRRELKSGSI